MRPLLFVALISSLVAIGTLLANYPRKPSLDWLYGCTVAQQAPSGECQ